MILVRQVLGDQLRRRRLAQQRTLRDVSADARVSLGYLSEVERGRKEPSSELLGSICAALDVSLSALLREVSDDLALQELISGAPVRTLPVREVAADGVNAGEAAPDRGVVVDLAA